jgi:hypothetical protein
MKLAELMDKAHEIRTMLNGLSLESRLQILHEVEKMCLHDIESVGGTVKPVLSLVTGG